MKDDEDRRQDRAKLGLLVVAPVVAALALLALRPKDEPAAPLAESGPDMNRTVEPKEAEPPPERAEAQPEAEATAQPAVEPPPAEMEAMRAALLGNPDDRPKGITALEQRATEKAEKQRRRRPVREATADDPPAEAEEDEGDLAGGLSDAAFRRTIEEWRGMKSCVTTSKARAEEASGALRMALTIADSGEVVDCRVFDESNDTARMVARCVERQVRTLKFPPFRGDERVVKEAKFVF